MVYGVLFVWPSMGYAWEGSGFVGLLDKGILEDIVLLMFGGPFHYVSYGTFGEKETGAPLKGLTIQF